MALRNGRSDTERRAFERELVELRPFLVSFAKSLTRSRERGEDLAQEALVMALAARDTFVPGTNLKAWVFTIARNKFFTDRRRAWRQAPWDEEWAKHIPIKPEQEHVLDLQDVGRMMLLLSEEYRRTLIVVGALGHNYKKASKILGCPSGTIKSRRARACRFLQEALESPVPPLPQGQARPKGRGPHKAPPDPPPVVISLRGRIWKRMRESGALDEFNTNLEGVMRGEGR